MNTASPPRFSGPTEEFLWDVFDAVGHDAFAKDLWCGRWMNRVDVEFRCREIMAGADIGFLSAPWARIHALFDPDCANKPAVRKARELLSSRPVAMLCDQIATQPRVTVLQMETVLFEQAEFMSRCGVKLVFHPGGGRLERDILNAHGIATSTMPYLPPRHLARADRKDILFSFVGCNTERGPSIRPLIKRQFPRNPHVVFSQGSHWAKTGEDAGEREAAHDAIMGRSRFALCPAGASPQTVRFFEALSVGAVPVVIAEDWDGPEWDWDRTCVRLTPEQFAGLVASPANFTMWLESFGAREEAMREMCFRAWDVFRPESVGAYLAQMAPKIGPAVVRSPYSFPKARGPRAEDYIQFRQLADKLAGRQPRPTILPEHIPWLTEAR